MGKPRPEPKADRPSRIHWARHPIRATAMAVAAASVAWPLTSSTGVLFAIGGAVGGVLLGELIGRSRLRIWALLVVFAVLLGAMVLAGRIVTGTEIVAGTAGTRAALALGVILRFSTFSFVPVATLRALAVRVRGLVALELAAVVASIAFLLAAHRNGIVDRPYWLSDWAWRTGIDPTRVLLGIGAVTAVALTLLMVAETGRRFTPGSALSLVALAALALVLFDVGNLPKPAADNDLGLTQTSKGDPPKQTHGGDPAHQGGGKDQQQGQGQGQGQDQQQGQGQGQGQDQQQPQGQGQQQQQQQGQGQGQDQQQQQGQGQQQQQQGQGQQQQQQQGQGQQQQQQQGQSPQEPNVDSPSSSPEAKQAPMAVVTLRDDYSPPSQMYYFRQEPWSLYNGQRLVTPVRSDVDRDVMNEYPTLETAIVDPPATTGRALIHADVAMLVEHKAPFFLESASLFKPTLNPNPQRFVRAYRTESLSQAVDYKELIGRKAGNPAWTEEVRKYYLDGPADPRYGELARKIVATIPPAQQKDPFLQALAVKMHFDKEFIYSSKERHAGAADPTADFLFGNKTGYCVHFAHAAVYLWRSLGIPARAGTGYATTEDDRLGATILIRSGDAHSWPELYLEGLGWVILDIAAERNLDPPTPPPDKELIRKLADSANDPQADEPNQAGEERIGQAPSAASIAWSLLILAALGLAALYAIKIWRRIAPSFAGARTIPVVGYRLALDLLTEAGLSRREGESRGQFAARVGSRAPSFEKLTELNVAARFGNPAVPHAERPEHSTATWRSELRTLRRELRAGTRFWRRLLGMLDPASFFASR